MLAYRRATIDFGVHFWLRESRFIALVVPPTPISVQVNDNIAVELTKLQDEVPPFPGEQARALIENALGQSVQQVFAEFDERPLASASIAQVHAARLRSGKDVVVKVVRPGITKTIRRDLALLYTIARLARKYSSEIRRLRPIEVVQEYEKTIFDELDLLREAANASQLRRNFLDSDLLYVPESVLGLLPR